MVPLLLLIPCFKLRGRAATGLGETTGAAAIELAGATSVLVRETSSAVLVGETSSAAVGSVADTEHQENVYFQKILAQRRQSA